MSKPDVREWSADKLAWLLEENICDLGADEKAEIRRRLEKLEEIEFDALEVRERL